MAGQLSSLTMEQMCDRGEICVHTLPALKKAVMRSVLKQRSVAHIPQRYRWGFNKLPFGIMADSSRGSSRAAVWLLTVTRPWSGGRLKASRRNSLPWISVEVSRLIKPLLMPPTAPSTALCNSHRYNSVLPTCDELLIERYTRGIVGVRRNLVCLWIRKGTASGQQALLFWRCTQKKAVLLNMIIWHFTESIQESNPDKVVMTQDFLIASSQWLLKCFF